MSNLAFLDDLRRRYRALTARERLAVTIAGVVLGLFLVDRLAVAPLLAARRSDRRAIAHDRRLLAWMNGVAQRVDALRRQNVHPAADGPLTLAAQQSLSARGLSATKIETGGSGTVKVVFATVPFPALVGWLHAFAIESGARVRSLTLRRKPHSHGLVSATVTLRRRPPS
jgi:general secretion pathway protein M